MTKRSRSRRRGRRRDGGDATLELLILAPVILALIALLVAAGRTSIAQGAVQAAARDAARQASIARSPAEAHAAALASATFALRQDSLDCRPVVNVNTSGFGVPVGQPAHVSASVTCVVRLSDLLVPGLPTTAARRGTVALSLSPRSQPHDEAQPRTRTRAPP